MSKKIDAAARDLAKAVLKHSRAVTDKHAGKAKVQKATARLHTAATSYVAVVFAQTGAMSPFVDIADPRLDAQTLSSLKAERDALSRRQSAKKPAETSPADELSAPDVPADDPAGAASE